MSLLLGSLVPPVYLPSADQWYTTQTKPQHMEMQVSPTTEGVIWLFLAVFHINFRISFTNHTHTHTHDWNSIEFICQLVKNQHFNDIESIQERDIWLHGHWFLTTLGKVYSFFHKGLSYILLDLCLIYFFATVNIFYFLIIVSDPLFLICKNAIDIFLIFLKNWFFFLRF